MTQHFPVRAVAGCFALTAFSVAIISALYAGRGTASVLELGLVSLLGGQILGFLFALILRAGVREYLDQYVLEHPLGSTQQEASDGTAEAAPEISAPLVEAA